MIASSHNETVKRIRRLRQGRGDHALLEGPHLVREALDLGFAIEPVLMTEGFAGSPTGGEIVRRLRAPPKLVEARLLESLSDADAPRGVLAVANLPRRPLASAKPGADRIWLYLDAIQEPGNLGAIARTAEGLGAAGMLLAPGCADPRHSRALRASAGSLLRLPVFEGVEPAAARSWSGPAPWIGLEAHAGSERLDAMAVTPPFVLAIGAEGQGLSPPTHAALDRTVTIPLAGRLESLNVAVAVALVLYEFDRKCRAPHPS